MASRSWDDPGSAFGVASAIFALTALPAEILFIAIYGDVETGILFGFFFGLAFSISMVPFMRSQRVKLHFADRAEFERRLIVEMSGVM